MPRGRIKWFDPAEGKGIIKQEEGTEIEVEAAEIIPSEENLYSRIKKLEGELPAGVEVSFELAEGEEGLKAKNVVRLK